MIRIYLKQKLESNSVILLNEKTNHYLIKVMRCKVLDKIIIFNGYEGEFLGIIKEIYKKNTYLYVSDHLRKQVSCQELSLIFAPIKQHRLSFLIEKATELGVTKFVPITTQYTIMKNINIEKLEKIAIEAAEQSGRMDVPQFEQIQNLHNLLDIIDGKKIILCSEHENNNNISTFKDFDSVIVGPEGGFSDSEIKKLINHPAIKSCSLGVRILRAETASIAALSFLSLNRLK